MCPCIEPAASAPRPLFLKFSTILRLGAARCGGLITCIPAFRARRGVTGPKKVAGGVFIRFPHIEQDPRLKPGHVDVSLRDYLDPHLGTGNEHVGGANERLTSVESAQCIAWIDQQVGPDVFSRALTKSN